VADVVIMVIIVVVATAAAATKLPDEPSTSVFEVLRN
jgi:hypothetical protein